MTKEGDPQSLGENPIAEEDFQPYLQPDASYEYTDLHDTCRTQVRALSADYMRVVNPLQRIAPLSDQIQRVNQAISTIDTRAFVQSYRDLLQEKKQASPTYFAADIEKHTPFYYPQLIGNTAVNFDWSGIHAYAHRREEQAHTLIGEAKDVQYSLGHHLLRGLNTFKYSFTTPGIERIMEQDGGWEFTKGYLETIFNAELPNFPVTFDASRTNSSINTDDINNISVTIGTNRQVASAQALIILVEEVFEASLAWKLHQSKKWDTNSTTNSIVSQGVKELLSGFVIDNLITSDYLEKLVYSDSKESVLDPEEIASLRRTYQQEYLAEMLCSYLVNGGWEIEVTQACMKDDIPDAKALDDFMTKKYMEWQKRIWTPNIYSGIPAIQDKTWARIGAPLVHSRRFPLFLPVYTTRFLATVCESSTPEKLQAILNLVQEEGPNTTIEQCIYPNDTQKQKTLVSQRGISREWMNKLNTFLLPAI